MEISQIRQSMPTVGSSLVIYGAPLGQARRSIHFSSCVMRIQQKRTYLTPSFHESATLSHRRDVKCLVSLSLPPTQNKVQQRAARSTETLFAKLSLIFQTRLRSFHAASHVVTVAN